MVLKLIKLPLADRREENIGFWINEKVCLRILHFVRRMFFTFLAHDLVLCGDSVFLVFDVLCVNLFDLYFSEFVPIYLNTQFSCIFMTVRFFIACLEDFFELFCDFVTFSICFVCSFIRPKFLQDYLNLPHGCLVILCYLGFDFHMNLPQLLSFDLICLC